MKQKNVKDKVRSILVIVILVFSGLLLIMPLNPDLNIAKASSVWVQTSDSDFKQGTLNNTTITGNGDTADLRIDLSGIQTWTKLSTAFNPIAGLYHATASVYGDDKIVLFGGYWYYAGYWYYNETWVYDLSENSWTRKYPENKPSARRYHAMASIWGDDKILLFGGVYGTYFDDTWVYDVSDNTWTNMNPTNYPNGRYYHSMASISGDDKVVLFGGLSSTGINDETWVYDLNENKWTQMTPANAPSPRYYHSMASIDGTDKVLVFGGYYYYNDDIWVYDLSDNDWIQKSPMIRPCYRWYHAMATIYGTDQVLLFGGYGNWPYYYNYLNDTWIYDFSNDVWIQRTTKTNPTAGYYHAMAGIYGTDKVMLFGGYNPTYGYWSETWMYKHFLPTKNGTFISTPYDTCANSSFNTISWNGVTSMGTHIKFQIRTASNESNLNTKDFIGPNGITTTFYTSTPSELWSGHTGDRWVQYKIYFNIDFFTDSPIIKDVTISYNCLPNIIVIGPINGSIQTNNKPTFVWTFSDYDSERQRAFQVLIDDDRQFESINYDTGEQTTAEERWEFPTGTNYIELPDGTWYWKVRTKDPDGVWTKYSNPWTIIIDTTTPNSALTLPINNEFYNSLDTITGIANDTTTGSGVTKVELIIKRLSDNYFWTGNNWVPLPSWLSASGTTEWTYNSNTITWTSGCRYLIQSRATDKATNIEIPSVSNIFTIDMDRPVSRISMPMDDTWLNTLGTIDGTSTDNEGSGVAKVEISVRCNKDKKFWTGSGWNLIEYWFTATGTDQWSLDTSTIPWETGSNIPWLRRNHYTINSRATDIVGNIEIPGQGVNFGFDDQPPKDLSIVINNDQEYTTSINVTLSLQGEDIGSGISQMAFSTDDKKWSDWEPFSETKSYKLSAGDGEKIVYFKVQDIVGNIAESVFDTIILDTTPPENLYININHNAEYTNSTWVSLYLSATDSLSGLGDMSFYNGIKWTPMEPFKNTKSIDLQAGDGEKNIYFKISDKVGNIAKAYDSIILDTKPPHSLWILINNGASETNSTFVTLKLNAIDDTSGLNQISFSNDGINWSPWEDYTEMKYYSLSRGDGPKTVYFKVKDRAGNIANPVFETIYLNTQSSMKELQTTKTSFSILEVILLLLIIIIILLTIIIVGLMRKRKKHIDQELLPTGTFIIKPGGLFGPEISLAQVPGAIKLAQLPSSTPTVAGLPSGQIASNTPVPLLVKSITDTHKTSPQFPQLPPAKIQAKSEEKKPTPIPTLATQQPTVASPSQIKSQTAAPSQITNGPVIIAPTPTVVNTIKPPAKVTDKNQLGPQLTTKTTGVHDKDISTGPKVHLPDSKTQTTTNSTQIQTGKKMK